jgi:short subunit dehydrogenase-like uncharacterized protein
MTWMVYGANGYTGTLIAKLAKERGETPVLAGRSAAKILPMAAELGLDHHVVDLADSKALTAALREVDVVVHCAGPFSRTATPMVDACLATRTHYVDITGEIDVFEAIYARDTAARDAGIVLLPGAGFDVVPTDCAAALAAAALPGATELEVAFTLGGGMSPGTLKTAIEGAAGGGRARVNGELTSVGLAHRQTTAEFPSGPKQVTAIPWGDVSSAFRSTAIPNITTYTVLPRGDLIGRGGDLLGPLLKLPSVQRAGLSLVDRLVRGPSEEKQARGHAEVWAKASDGQGHSASVALSTPNPYSFTADSVLRAVSWLTDDTADPAHEVRPGAHTPSSAFGPDFVRGLVDVVVGRLETR